MSSVSLSTFRCEQLHGVIEGKKERTTDALLHECLQKARTEIKRDAGRLLKQKAVSSLTDDWFC
jgi:hypothetical protein